MARLGRKGRWQFWALALLWLPAGVVAQAAVRFGADFGPTAEPGPWLATVPMMAASVVAGLLGPVTIAFFAVVLSVPVWVAWYWLVRRG